LKAKRVLWWVLGSQKIPKKSEGARQNQKKKKRNGEKAYLESTRDFNQGQPAQFKERGKKKKNIKRECFDGLEMDWGPKRYGLFCARYGWGSGGGCGVGCLD